MPQPRLMPLAAIFALTFGWAVEAAGAADPPPLVVDGQPFLTGLGGHLALFEDPSGTLTVDDVLSQPQASRFAPARGAVPSLGFTKSAIWLRVDIQSRSTRDETVLVELGMSRMRQFEWFVVDQGRVASSLACGTADAGARPRPRHPTISLVIPAGGKRTVYARAASDASIWLPLMAGAPMEFEQFAARRDFRDFFIAGFWLALVLLSLGLWTVGGRNGLYLSVAAAMIFGLLQVVIFNGIYAWLGAPWADWFSYQGLQVCVMLFVMAFARFGQDYLGWGNLYPLERNALRATYILCGAAAIVVAIVPYALSVRFVLPLEILALTVPAGVAMSVALRRRGRGMILFLLALLVLLAAVVLLVLQFFSIIPVLLAPSAMMNVTLPSVFFIFLLSGAAAQRAVLQMRAEVAAMQSAQTEARLEALRYQLNPHFLFNTLTTIEELSHIAPARIPRLIGRLADFLRLRLDPVRSSSITLEQELASVRAYLDIEKVRFEERLGVDYDIAPEAEKCLVPELILTPLVENAVKYGFEDSEVLRIRIAAHVHNGTLSLRVENNGRLQPRRRRAPGVGVGTENIRERLALEYGPRAAFKLEQIGDFVVADVEMPAVKSKS